MLLAGIIKMYSEYNPNPHNRRVGDCVIRAISKVLEMSWEDVFLALCLLGYVMGDLPSSNQVWGRFLRENGFTREAIPNDCPDCYTIEDFCAEHPQGIYVIGTGTHAVAIVDGCYYDTWQSGNETPIYYFRKEVE
jgi:hypothetical protein